MNVLFDLGIVNKYLDLMVKDPFHRYWSWDFCFNSFVEKKNKEELALSLAFYLASWGMYRGSGGLLQKNHRIHEKTVELLLSTRYDTLRCNKSNELNSSFIPLILDIKKQIGSYYNTLYFTRGGINKKVSDTDTLLSKVLLGTTGCVPAYDRYFTTGIKKSSFKKCRFDGDGMQELFTFIATNKTAITEAQKIAQKKTNNHYPVMKIIDMFFWQIGYDSKLEEKNKIQGV